MPFPKVLRLDHGRLDRRQQGSSVLGLAVRGFKPCPHLLALLLLHAQNSGLLIGRTSLVEAKLHFQIGPVILDRGSETVLRLVLGSKPLRLLNLSFTLRLLPVSCRPASLARSRCAC